MCLVIIAKWRKGFGCIDSAAFLRMVSVYRKQMTKDSEKNKTFVPVSQRQLRQADNCYSIAVFQCTPIFQVGVWVWAEIDRQVTVISFFSIIIQRNKLAHWFLIFFLYSCLHACLNIVILVFMYMYTVIFLYIYIVILVYALLVFYVYYYSSIYIYCYSCIYSCIYYYFCIYALLLLYRYVVIFVYIYIAVVINFFLKVQRK